VHKNNAHAYFEKADRVGQQDEKNGENMMENHNSKILPNSIHVDCGVYGVHVEAAFDEIQQLYFVWYF
jgi:hypothetical protein